MRIPKRVATTLSVRMSKDHTWASCPVVSSSADASDALADDQVVACFLDRGEHGEAMARQWNAVLQHSPGLTFDVSVIDSPSDAQARTSSSQPWQEQMLASLPCELSQHASKQALLAATLKEAEALIQTFRAARDYALDAPCSLRVRFACINQIQCPRLHWDDVPLRAVAVLTGVGTEVMPEEAVDRLAFHRLGQLSPDEQVALSTEEWNRAVSNSGWKVFPSWFDVFDSCNILQAPPGCAVLLKGSTWSNMKGAHTCLGAIHRSPSSSDSRVLLQVDDADAVI